MSGSGGTRKSLRKVIEERRSAQFVGRADELDRYWRNFDLPLEDPARRFVFHVHGSAGVGKTSLVQRLKAAARAGGALTGYVDDAVNSVPDAMAAISADAGRQGHRLKEFDRLMAAYRQRRHEAASVVDDPDQVATVGTGPSAGHLAVARAGLAGLGLIPGVGALAGAVDPSHVAEGTERIRARLSSRFRQDDVQLVMDPLPVLSPVFLAELEQAAASGREGEPRIALFFDSYERTRVFLDPWLAALFTVDRYGEPPAGLVVTTAGQRPLDRVRWADSIDLVAEIPLRPFTEGEARELLTARGVVDEPVVREVLRLSGRLPVLLTTLAANPGTAAGAVDDPSSTAVERFLSGEQDPVRRTAALDAALPRRLNEDVFAEAVQDDSGTLFAWLRAMPFVDQRAGLAVYHDVVRAPMLRLRRSGSPQRWIACHERLAEAFARWGATAAAGVDPERLWAAENWRDLRLEETYHRLCAQSRTALATALRDGIGACREGTAAARAWARMLAQAGEDTDSALLRGWGRDCLAALADETRLGIDLLAVLLARAELDPEGRVEALVVRARDLHNAGEYEASLADSRRALGLDPASAAALHGRGRTLRRLGDLDGALADLDRALELEPDFPWTLAERGEVHRLAGRYAQAVADLDRAVGGGLDHHWPLASRGHALLRLGRTEDALADLDRALELKPDYVWALLRRARARIHSGDTTGALADLTRAGALAPANAWIAGERGDAFRFTGRYDEALAEYGRALELDPTYAWALGSRAMALECAGRSEEALADLDRAIALEPDYGWALLRRAEIRERLGDAAGARADLARAETTTGGREAGELAASGAAHGLAGRHEEALADLDRALRLAPGHRPALWARVGTNLALGRPWQVLEDLTELARLPRAGADGGPPEPVDLPVDLVARRPGGFEDSGGYL
ncbi:tetratricopeptide repeat protein [Streptomyces sp. PKU-EA00015]|uniref:tetratricopeptide repeat protein n=1 Tax=Streptomyces sp. PKU-EA00015 TaxID=2748326 RepID=UPI0015A4C7CC|nr:tetratricopeptide repeat protein [Streptomyces sp. PKU-EA00015]NWF27962.1 tetratricopeptide repeat protein [Streptomyces sp. PKU-EA00015]